MKPTDSIAPATVSSRVRDVVELFKLRLAALVVFSSVLGYLMATSTPDWLQIAALCIGGFLLTGASNGFNQVWEREVDAKMTRTQNRPIPTGRMSVVQGLAYSTVAGILGIGFLFYFLNPLAGGLGALALFSYVFIYTPMKKASSLAVFVGAFPGAIPPMLGYVAASGQFGIEPGLLFAVQFMWQFPHFWAIAWVSHDDYAKADYRLLPFVEGKSARSAYQIFLYSLFLIPVSVLPWIFPIDDPMVGNWAFGVTLLCGLGFLYYAWRLVKEKTETAARKLMFSSFAYLPIVQIIYVVDKL